MRSYTNGRDEEEYERQVKENSDKRVYDLNNIPGVEFVRYLVSDPWFTSLWTLQEAFLCPEAMIMMKDARQSLRMWNEDPTVARLNVQQIVMILSMTYNELRTETPGDHTEAPNWTKTNLENIERAIEETGLLHLTSRCPTSLLAMAQYRQTSKDNQTDRVYGIMQCFDLRVGKSRPGARPDLVLTLDQLEDELGADLMAKNPVMSQLHVYQTTPPLGKGWRLTKESHPAPGLSGAYIHMSFNSIYKIVSHCRMSAIEMDNATWGTFEGPTIPLARLKGMWENQSVWHLELEVNIDCPKPVRFEPNKAEQRREFEEVDEILQRHPGALVLLLGENREDFQTTRRRSPKRQAFGLIIVPYWIEAPQQRCVWRRRAICAWMVLNAQLTAEMGENGLQRESDGTWERLEGILG